jgi:uncharacterized membrane protein
MIKERKPRRELKTHSKRAVTMYLLLLLVAAILLLLLAYFTQEHAFALTAAEVLAVV